MVEILPSLLVLGIILLLTGALSGFVAGLLGVGGGIIVMPMLYAALNLIDVESTVIMHTAIGTSLATIIPTSIASALTHNRKGALDWHLLRSWFLWILLGCLGGTWLANVIISGAILSTIFGCIAFLVALDLILRDRKQQQDNQRSFGQENYNWIYRPAAIPVPVSIGTFSALMGIGGGTLSVPFLNALKYPINRAVGTSAAFGLIISIPATVGYIWGGWDIARRPVGSLGYVNIYGFFLIAATSALFAPIGAQKAHKLSDRSLRLLFAGFLMITSATMI